jgi:hypothetical protein
MTRVRHVLLLWIVLAPVLPGAAQSVTITPTTVEDLAYAPATGRLYAVLPVGMGGPETSVAELDPANGAIVTRIPVPNGPSGRGATQVAVSDDGAVLFAGVDGGRTVRRYALPALTPGPEFTLGVDQLNQPVTVRDMKVVPGTSTSLVLSQAARFAAEIVAFDNGVARPDRVFGQDILFVTPSRLIAPNGSTARRVRLVASGLVPETPEIESLRGPLTVDGGIAHEFDGGITDLVTGQRLGTCHVSGTGVAAPDLDTVFYVAYGELVTCRRSTFLVTGALPVSGLNGYYASAVRTATGRLALVEFGGRLLIVDGLTTPLPAPLPAPAGSPWNPSPLIAARVQLTGCTTCRPGDLFSVHGALVDPSYTNVEVKAAVIMPNGAAIPASILGTSHLEVGRLSTSVGATLLRVVMPPGLPAGTWRYEMALLDPATGAVWSRSSAAFEVRP